MNGIIRSGFRAALAVVIVMAFAMVPPDGARAQVGPGGIINPGRDCQTILQCRFQRGGVYRGCISAYSCRRCRFVASRTCDVGADGRRARSCQRLVCDWR